MVCVVSCVWCYLRTALGVFPLCVVFGAWMSGIGWWLLSVVFRALCDVCVVCVVCVVCCLSVVFVCCVCCVRCVLCVLRGMWFVRVV